VVGVGLLSDYAQSTIKAVFTVFKRALSLAASLELIANDPLQHVTYRQFAEKFLENKALEEFELTSVYESCEKYRKRLCDISWFMRELNESVACMVSLLGKSDKCTGHFYSLPSLALTLRAA